MNKPRYFAPMIVIPDNWTPDQARTTVSFLRRITEAIWAAHGVGMNRRLHQAHVSNCPNVIPFSYGLHDDDDDEDDNDDMPF